MSIEFDCESCGKHYKVADAMAGKRAKCKACGGVIQVPALVEDPPLTMEDDAPVPPVKPASQRPVTKAPSQPQDTAPKCPSCQAPLAPKAVLCIACGFDLRKGVKIAGVGDNDDEEGKPTPSEANDNSPAASPIGKGKVQKPLIGILIGVVLIAMAIFAYHLRTK